MNLKKELTMQFAPTNVEPSPDSKVTVTFAGLMLIKPADGNALEAGVHKFSRDHSFQVMLVVNQPGLPPRVIRLCQGPLFSDFEMNVNPAGAGVQKFVPNDDAFDPSNGANNKKDFRWAFNFAALPGHDQVDINDGARPTVKLNAGVLYSANLTREDLEPTLQQGFNQIPLHRFSMDLAASVELPENSKMTLTWKDLGTQQIVALPRDTDPEGTTYTVAVLNDPPVFYDPAAGEDPSSHDEFDEYYKVLQIGNAIVPNKIRCHIKLPPNHRSDEIPCLIGVVEKPGTH